MPKVSANDVFSRLAAKNRAIAAEYAAREAVGDLPDNWHVAVGEQDEDTPRKRGKDAAAYERPREAPDDLGGADEAEWLAGYDEQAGTA